MIRHFFRPVLPCLLVLATALAVSSCGSSTATPTTPTVAPTTDTFTDTITTNGASTHPFTASAAGVITVTLTSLTPDTTAVVGLSLGTWNGSQCQLILTNDKATQGSIVTGNVSTTSSLCVRVADSTGTLAHPETYVVSVAHP